jgi:hypothetical protein
MTFGQTPETRAAVTGKLAVRHLVHYSSLPALALANEVRKTAEPRPYPGQAVYDRIAADAHLFIDSVVRPLPNGFEHVMFLSKVKGLSDSELMSCRRPRTFNRHDPRGPEDPI